MVGTDSYRHSFGSALTYALVSSGPTISDDIVLTGFTLNSSFTLTFEVGSNFVQAYLNQPYRFGNISDATAQAIAALQDASVEEVLNQ